MPFKKNDPQTKEWSRQGHEAYRKLRDMWEEGGQALCMRYLDEMQNLAHEDPKAFRKEFAPSIEFFMSKKQRAEIDITSKGDKITSIPVEIIKPE